MKSTDRRFAIEKNKILVNQPRLFPWLFSNDRLRSCCLDRPLLEEIETMEDIISIVCFILHLLWGWFMDLIWRVLGFYNYISGVLKSYFAGFVFALQHLNVWIVVGGAFIFVVTLQLAPEARNALEQNTVAARNGGAGLNEGCLDLLIVVWWGRMSLITGGVTIPYMTINCVEGFGEFARILVRFPGVLVIEIVDKVAISSAAGSLQETDRKCLASRDGTKKSELYIFYRIDIILR